VDLLEEWPGFLKATINLSIPLSSGNSLPKVKVKNVKASMGTIRGKEGIFVGHRGKRIRWWMVYSLAS
jgi:hypothetical protein